MPAADFADEAALHGLVEIAPQLLPLAGSPQLVVVGREVSLGGGYADLIAIEPSGRIVVIEVKLARNSEARRAVVAQILTYAAFLHGMEPAVLERDVLGRHLRERGYESLAGALAANDQEGTFDAEAFDEALELNLASGAFRLVLVLDQAPKELTRLIGYIEAVGDQLLIDLVTVTPYDIAGTRTMVPQRVDPERVRLETTRVVAEPRGSTTPTTTGADEFIAAIPNTAVDRQSEVRRLANWAVELEREGLVRLVTGHGKDGPRTLVPRLRGDEVGLVTIWSDGGVSLWRTVFERRATSHMTTVEDAVGAPIGNGNTVRNLSDHALGALRDAYRSAAADVTRPQTPLAAEDG